MKNPTRSVQQPDLVVSGKIFSPHAGVVVPLEEVSDPIFAKRILGDGVSIRPDVILAKSAAVLSPITGKVLSVAHSGHAFGLRSPEGAEFLVHIGVDTVALQGKGFAVQVSAGQSVQVGDEICLVDWVLLEEAGYQAETIVLLSNISDFRVTLAGLGKTVSAREIIANYKHR